MITTLTSAGTRALGSLFAPGMLGVLLVSMLITLCALGGFVVGSTLLAGWFGGSGVAWVGGFAISSLVAWVLFPGIMPIIVNFFDQRIASLIEAQDYPNAPAPISPPFWPEFWHDARFSLMAVALNLLILPLILILPLYVFLFYLLNGYLLGREFFVMVARRHLPLSDALALRKKYAVPVLGAGVALTFMATVPFLNLIAPFWGIAVMTHLFHRLAPARAGIEILPPTI